MADKKISQLTASTVPLAGTEALPIVQSGATVKVAVSNLTAGRDVTVAKLLTTDNVGVGTNNPTDTNSWGRAVDVRGASVSGYSGVYMGNSDMTVRAYIGGGGAAGGGLGYIGTAINDPFNVYVGNGLRAQWDTSGNYKIENGNLVIGTSGKGIDFSADGQAAGMTSELLDDYEEGTWTPAWGVTNGTITANASSSGRYRKVGDTVTVWGYISYETNSGASGDVWVTGLPFTAGDGFGQGSGQSGGGVVYVATLWASNHPQTVQIPNNSTILNLLRPTYSGSPVSSSAVQFSDMWLDVNYSQTVFMATYRV